ncbi:MAG: sigma-E factor negative regulatory protein [Thalassolituus sp.]
MKDRINESLSALCDGECDELELRRVLNYVSNDPEMRDRWNRYNLIGAVMREESARVSDISRGVMQALDGMPVDDVAAPEQQSSALATHPVRRNAPDWLVSGAVAASVTLAVLFGARIMNDVTSAPSMMMAATPVQQVGEGASVSEQRIEIDGRSGQLPATVGVTTDELRVAQETLEQYVRDQSGQNAAAASVPAQVAPYARVANFGRDTGVKE